MIPHASSPLEIVAIRPSSETLDVRIERVVDALAAGQPAASLELVRRAGADDEALVYWAAIHQRLRRSEFGTALAEMDAVLAEAGEAEEDWSGSDEADSRYSHCRQPWHRWRTGRPSDIVGWANINSRPLRWPYADRR